MRELLITFDTEDYISSNSIPCLNLILGYLKKYDLTALFFITGLMAERLAEHPHVVDMLQAHEIGYHSSGHSVHPTIFEFTDVESYEVAYNASVKRETSHINPLTGEPEGKGGIHSLRQLFPNKKIVAYRSPGFCWSPPHTEALRDLGLKFDFSTRFSSVSIFHKGLTFYPYPAIYDWSGKASDYINLFSALAKREVTVSLFHPDTFVNKESWDSIYFSKQPEKILPPRPRTSCEFQSFFRNFGLFLKWISHLEKMRLLETKPKLKKSGKKFVFTKSDVEKIYEYAVRWPRNVFNYEPKYLHSHFCKFFNVY